MTAEIQGSGEGLRGGIDEISQKIAQIKRWKIEQRR